MVQERRHLTLRCIIREENGVFFVIKVSTKHGNQAIKVSTKHGNQASSMSFGLIQFHIFFR
jgi:hypothetical protein